jgi:hypothetical protein
MGQLKREPSPECGFVADLSRLRCPNVQISDTNGNATIALSTSDAGRSFDELLFAELLEKRDELLRRVASLPPGFGEPVGGLGFREGHFAE